MGSIRQPKDDCKKTRRGRSRSSKAAKYSDPKTCNRLSRQTPSPQWDSFTALQISDKQDGPINARKTPSKKTPSAEFAVSQPSYTQDGQTNNNALYHAALQPSIPRASFLCRRCNGPVSALTYICLDEGYCGADNTHIFNRQTSYNELYLAELQPLIPRASFLCSRCNGPVSALTYVCLDDRDCGVDNTPMFNRQTSYDELYHAVLQPLIPRASSLCIRCNGPVSALTYICLDDWYCGADNTHILKWAQLIQEAHLHLHDGNDSDDDNDNENDKDLQEYRKQACAPVLKSLLDVAGGKAAAAGRPKGADGGAKTHRPLALVRLPR
ncbi:hypothetical protein MBM_04981 [Drepanopeziza brunnea f. sp. 'multigermtubi' MB_m1]|uniref:Uncharacterized protein n=1 Tax=Marssonina brunnea f. sp. multigermtubi (strain MB_m1) TaxID=1072389 RepID=K1WVK8_MARBU|nr:uncharacterized protein MBM_04981 [Drepanopeziza brunnea f. sp. 'multigermtubi' MB_m1]EKD16512.1 hypothetical protein MBM_04981 [Drepanopeziza brunnea f. sp. 'multigermtubi' MB_m1]